jgi:hypothetical protein
VGSDVKLWDSLPKSVTPLLIVAVLDFVLKPSLLSHWSMKNKKKTNIIFFLCLFDPTRARASFWRFLDHTQRSTTVGRTPLDEWSARRRYLFMTTHNTHNRQTPTSPVGFEPTISAREQPQIYALDRAAIGTGTVSVTVLYFTGTTIANTNNYFISLVRSNYVNDMWIKTKLNWSSVVVKSRLEITKICRCKNASLWI